MLVLLLALKWDKFSLLGHSMGEFLVVSVRQLDHGMCVLAGAGAATWVTELPYNGICILQILLVNI